MNTFIIFSAALFSLQSLAAETHVHREHGAHVHGSATLALAFEGPQGKVEFKSAADSIVGFEHAAKTGQDKAKLAAEFKKLETQISEMIVFDPALKCQFQKDKLEMTSAATAHSDVLANYSVTCSKSPGGTTVKFNFQKFFPALKDIDAQIIVDNLQKSLEIKADGTSLDLY